MIIHCLRPRQTYNSAPISLGLSHLSSILVQIQERIQQAFLVQGTHKSVEEWFIIVRSFYVLSLVTEKVSLHAQMESND
jgi:hypothetical protein